VFFFPDPETTVLTDLLFMGALAVDNNHVRQKVETVVVSPTAGRQSTTTTASWVERLQAGAGANGRRAISCSSKCLQVGKYDRNQQYS